MGANKIPPNVVFEGKPVSKPSKYGKWIILLIVLLMLFCCYMFLLPDPELVFHG